jgi:hypothetical protein
MIAHEGTEAVCRSTAGPSAPALSRRRVPFAQQRASLPRPCLCETYRWVRRSNVFVGRRSARALSEIKRPIVSGEFSSPMSGLFGIFRCDDDLAGNSVLSGPSRSDERHPSRSPVCKNINPDKTSMRRVPRARSHVLSLCESSFAPVTVIPDPATGAFLFSLASKNRKAMEPKRQIIKSARRLRPSLATARRWK